MLVRDSQRHLVTTLLTEFITGWTVLDVSDVSYIIEDLEGRPGQCDCEVLRQVMTD